VKVITGNANALVETVIGEMPQPGRNHKVLGFCFLDPYQLQNLHFSTIRMLSQRFMDFLVLIPSSMDANRNEQNYLKPRTKESSGSWAGINVPKCLHRSNTLSLKSLVGPGTTRWKILLATRIGALAVLRATTAGSPSEIYWRTYSITKLTTGVRRMRHSRQLASLSRNRLICSVCSAAQNQPYPNPHSRKNRKGIGQSSPEELAQVIEGLNEIIGI
jgi:hypothetical protein